MNIISSELIPSLDRPSGLIDSRGATANRTLFNDLMDSVATRIDDHADADGYVDLRNDDADLADREAFDREASEDDARDDEADRQKESDEPPQDANAAGVHVPFGLDTAVRSNSSAASAAAKGSAAAAVVLNIAKPQQQLSAQLQLNAHVTQDRPGVRFQPLNTITNGIVSENAENLLSARATAQTAANKLHAAGQNAVEKVTLRKFDHQLVLQSATQETSGKAATFSERMGNLFDRLSQQLPGTDAAPQLRSAQPSPANPLGAALVNRGPAGPADTQLALISSDDPVDVLQLATQTANRAVTSGSATMQTASRAPQLPAGTPAEQVSVQIQHGLRNDTDRINVRLYPAALGKVEVKLELAPDKTVQAIVTAEKSETLDMLARDARILQRALEEAGFRTDSNSLSFHHEGDNGNAGDTFDKHAGHGAMDRQTGTTEEPAADLAATDEQNQHRAEHDGVLDVEV